MSYYADATGSTWWVTVDTGTTTASGSYTSPYVSYYDYRSQYPSKHSEPEPIKIPLKLPTEDEINKVFD